MKYTLSPYCKGIMLEANAPKLSFALPKGTSIKYSYDFVELKINDSCEIHYIAVFAENLNKFLTHTMGVCKDLTYSTKFIWINDTIDMDRYKAYQFDEIIIVGDKKNIDIYYIMFMPILERMKEQKHPLKNIDRRLYGDFDGFDFPDV